MNRRLFGALMTKSRSRRSASTANLRSQAWSEQAFCIEEAHGKADGRAWSHLPEGESVDLHRVELRTAQRRRGKRWTGVRLAGPALIRITGPAIIRKSDHDYAALMMRRRTELRQRLSITLAHVVLGAAMTAIALSQGFLGPQDRIVLASAAGACLFVASVPLVGAAFWHHHRRLRKKMRLPKGR